mmetsp:Transcript_34120/g.79980  ORF Transcript_34120/g.79980 Transcript_34120/m.79980 type:complete len:217 (-) Transcript_34120:117-767(-)
MIVPAFSHGHLLHHSPLRPAHLLPSSSPHLLGAGYPRSSNPMARPSACSSVTMSAGSGRSRSPVYAALSVVLACMALTGGSFLVTHPETAHAEIIKDEYGGTKQRVCPVAYFPCYQDGIFCFRPIYCEGVWSPEGTLNAMIIFGGILGPAYSIWRRKAGLDPDPNTEEGMAELRRRWKLRDAKSAAADKPKELSKFFGKKQGEEKKGEEKEGEGEE